MPKQFNLKELSESNHTHGDKALEMIMRDVIDGMEDLANLAGYTPQPGGCFEILEISPEEYDPLDTSGRPSAEIIPLKK